MKNTGYLLFVLFSFITANAQKLQPVEVKDKALSSLFGSITSLDKYTFGNNNVTVIVAKDIDSPQHSSETDEVADKLFLSNCETGEGTDCRLYVLKNLTALKVDKVYEENGKIKVTISYGNAKARKSDTVIVPVK